MSSIQKSTAERTAGDKRIRVMQVVDTLDIGGAERVAVNLANLLPAEGFESYLCTTRRDGQLASKVAPHVTRVSLNRKGRFDSAGVRRMVAFITAHGIQILHAHGSSLFISRIASLVARLPLVIWHDHYGKLEIDGRSAWLYRLATRGVGVIAVNQPLAEWSRSTLRIPADHVWYVPNWAEAAPHESSPQPLPGSRGSRIICVANLRAQKDHMNLLRSMVRVKATTPGVHLILVGPPTEPGYADYIRAQITALQLEQNVTWLGAREDVAAILENCDIAVLSSVSEGLPLVLLEFGLAGLPVVSTDVGECRAVLDDGRAGLLVPPSAPEELAAALTRLLKSPELRASLGSALKVHVSSHFNSRNAVGRICEIYQSLLVGRAA